MWDSGVRKALKTAAKGADCDFPGFGLHSLRRANITMTQEAGASAIEASKIAGHATVKMTGDYNVVQLERQEELTQAIQDRVSKAREKQQRRKNTNGTTECEAVCVRNGLSTLEGAPRQVLYLKASDLMSRSAESPSSSSRFDRIESQSI